MTVTVTVTANGLAARAAVPGNRPGPGETRRRAIDGDSDLQVLAVPDCRNGPRNVDDYVVLAARRLRSASARSAGVADGDSDAASTP